MPSAAYSCFEAIPAMQAEPTSPPELVSSSTARHQQWTIPGWHRWLFVSDDEKSVIVGYHGMNLVPISVTLDEPVFFFYNQGRLVHTVTLGDLYEEKSQLKRTVSHFAWVQAPYINQANQLVVELVDGRELAFAADTGQIEELVPDES